MSEPRPDPATTRPPSEGGWFRVDGEPAEDGARWDPIPRFLPSGIVPAPSAMPAPPAPPSRRRRLPERPCGYPQLLRGPTRAWWRPVLSLLVLLVAFAVLTVPAYLLTMAYGLLTGAATLDTVEAWTDAETSLEGVLGPGGFLFSTLLLIGLIPAAALAIWAVHRIRPGFLSSVAGRLRWRWLLRCLVALSPLWVLYLTISTLVDPPQSPRPEQWLVLLVMAVLLTPGQAAAEEYVFRGWVLQNIGAYFARPLLAFVVPTVVGAAAFAAAHGSPDPWILADLVLFAVVASVLTWRTGGLEAAIVMHTVNNIGVFAVTVTVGGWAEAFVGEETRGTPLAFGVSVLLHGIALVLIWWQARRTGLDRWYRPVSPPTLPPLPTLPLPLPPTLPPAPPLPQTLRARV